MVHRRIVSALEQITGGGVELGRFTVVPFRFRVEIYDLTIHGKEASSDVPYAHTDHAVAEISVISIFEKEFGFHAIALDHPVIHIISYPDGTTNQSKGAADLRRICCAAVVFAGDQSTASYEGRTALERQAHTAGYFRG